MVDGQPQALLLHAMGRSPRGGSQAGNSASRGYAEPDPASEFNGLMQIYNGVTLEYDTGI